MNGERGSGQVLRDFRSTMNWSTSLSPPTTDSPSRYIRTVRDTGIEPVTSSVSGKRSLLSGCVVLTMTSSSLFGGSGTGAPQGQPQAGPGSLPTEQNSRNGQNVQKGDMFAKAFGAGSFAPEEQGNALFNPCEEITKEQWESLGWDLQHLPNKESSNYAIHCMLKSAKTDNRYSMLSITTDNSKYDDVIKHGKDELYPV